MQPIDQVLLSVLRRVVGKHSSTLALHEPEFSEAELNCLKDCIDSTYVSSVGKYVDQFEEMLATFTGAKHAVAVVNGTSALHIALTLAGVRPLDEVLLPTLSFVATANAVAYCGAIPNFVDSSMDTMGISSDALSEYLCETGEITGQGLRNKHTGRRLAAIVPMHTYGHPVDMFPILDIANRYRLPVVEDAAESLGSKYDGRHTGTFGLLGTLSFNGNKIITTGGGGAILTNDSALARRAKHITTTAKVNHKWEFTHDEIAWNYRMPNLNAALGCAQIDRLPSFIENKRVLAGRYQAALMGCADFHFMAEPKQACSNYWLSTVRLASPNMDRRNQLLTVVNEAGYQCRPSWTLLHKLPMFSESPRAPVSMAERLEASLINLPSSAKLGRLHV